MAMRRIQVYADAETKRRIELAAAKRNLPVTAYCLEAIMQQLSEDEVLDRERIEISVKPGSEVIDAKLLDQMQALREKILARRGGEPITEDILEQLRVERDEDLLRGLIDLR